MFFTGLRAKQMGRRYLTDSLISTSQSRIAWDKKMTASLPVRSCTFSWSDHDGVLPQIWRPAAATVPPTGQPTHKHTYNDTMTLRHEEQHVSSFARAKTRTF